MRGKVDKTIDPDRRTWVEIFGVSWVVLCILFFAVPWIFQRFLAPECFQRKGVEFACGFFNGPVDLALYGFLCIGLIGFLYFYFFEKRSSKSDRRASLCSTLFCIVIVDLIVDISIGGRLEGDMLWIVFGFLLEFVPIPIIYFIVSAEGRMPRQEIRVAASKVTYLFLYLLVSISFGLLFEKIKWW